ncbi:hypothetical protein B0H14DRAFT_2392313, partial [Mycena olivaceomarginata]
SRMSVMFSVIRLLLRIMPLTRCKLTSACTALFALCWVGLVIQKVHLYASDKSWYKSHRPQQCNLGKEVIAFQLVRTSDSDGFADFTLAIIPITLIRQVSIPATQRKILSVIFAASVLTTLVSIVHAVVLLGPGGSLEGVAVEAEVSFSPYLRRLLTS